MIRDRWMAIVSWWPLVVVLAIAIPLTLIYIRDTFVNFVYLDAFIQVPYVGDFLGGGSFLSALFTAPFAGEHLLLGYRLWQLINGRFFGMNMVLDPVMYMFAYTFTTVVFFAEFRKTFARERQWILFLLFLPIGFLCFSLVAPVGINMTVEFVWGTAVALLIAFFMQRYIDLKSVHPRLARRKVAFAVLCIPMYFAFLSGAYFPGFLFGLVAMYLSRALLQRIWVDRGFFLAGAVALASSLTYMYFMITTQAKGAETSGGIAFFFEHPGDAALAYLASLAASIEDSYTLTAHSPDHVALIGGAMVVIVAFSLWMFVRTGMYKVTYVPIFCIFFPVGIATSQFVGRETLFGWEGITAIWYSFELRFYVVGTVWILLYTLIHEIRAYRVRSASIRWAPLVPITVVVVAMCYIGACQWKSNSNELVRSPFVKQYYGLREEALVYPQFVTDPAGILLWPASQVVVLRATLKRYHLSSFSAGSLRGLNQSLAEQPITSGDWHSDGWVGRRGSIVLFATHRGRVTMAAYVPPFLRHDRVTLRVNGAMVFDGIIGSGMMKTVSAPLRDGPNVIAATASTAKIPADIGAGADIRSLGVRVSVQRSSS